MSEIDYLKCMLTDRGTTSCFYMLPKSLCLNDLSVKWQTSANTALLGVWQVYTANKFTVTHHLKAHPLKGEPIQSVGSSGGEATSTTRHSPLCAITPT